MVAAAILLVLCQRPPDPVRAAEAVEMLAHAQTHRPQGLDLHARREFAERFNRLVTALKNFEEAYSRDKGAVWPSKQAANLETAMRALTDSPGWRRTE